MKGLNHAGGRLALAVAVSVAGYFNYTPAHAGLELVCAGSASAGIRNVKQVDCSSAASVSDQLASSAQALHRSGAGEHIKSLCTRAWNDSMHIESGGISASMANGLLQRCNQGLKYLR